MGAIGQGGRETCVGGLGRVLERVPSIEDVRVKVKGAECQPGGDSGEARIWFFIVGRNVKGQREWLTAWARIGAHKEREGNWRIHRFQLESFSSMTAERELFSEVALPAGVHHEFPPFGTEPNDTVAAHGVAVADVNGDGLLDVVTRGVAHNPLYPHAGSGWSRVAP